MATNDSSVGIDRGESNEKNVRKTNGNYHNEKLFINDETGSVDGLAEESFYRRPITSKQKQVLDFIIDYYDRTGIAPLIEEIKNEIDVASSATVYEHLVELEKRGYIKREPYKSRAITLLNHNGINRNVSLPQLSQAPNSALEIGKNAVLKASTFEQAHRMLFLANILEITRARSISLYLIAERDDQLLLVPEIWQGCWRENTAPRIFVRGQGIAGKVWEKGLTEYISEGDVQNDEFFEASNDPKSKSVQSICCIPVYGLHGETVGVLNLDSNIVNRFKKYKGVGEKLKTFMSNINNCGGDLNSQQSILMYLYLFQLFLSQM